MICGTIVSGFGLLLKDLDMLMTGAGVLVLSLAPLVGAVLGFNNDK